MTEVWKSIYLYKGLYEVSSRGRVRSLDRKIKTVRGVWNYSGKVLQQSVNQKGYPYLVLCLSGYFVTFRTHRLVAKAFVCNPKSKPQVNHIDGNKTNNHSRNLAWVTNSENQIHSLDNDLRKTKLQKEDIKYIRKLHGTGWFTYYTLGDMFGVDFTTIGKAVIKSNWGRV